MNITIKKYLLSFAQMAFLYYIGLNFRRLWRRHQFMKQFKNTNDLNTKLQSCQSKDLVNLKGHFIYGECVPNKQTIDIKYSIHHFMMIQRIKIIYQGQSTTKKITQLWVDSFKLNTKQIKNTIVDLKQFKPMIQNHLFTQLQGHSKKSNNQSNKSFFSMVAKFIKNAGRSVKYINQGIMFDTQMLIIGDFLYNPDTKLLRCYYPKYFGNPGDLDTYIFEQKVINFLSVIINAGLLYGTVYLIYKTIINQRKQQQEQKKQLNHAIVLKDRNTFKCMKCKINNHNIVYIPCFHFILCDSCASLEINCQVCQKHITKKVKIYMG